MTMQETAPTWNQADLNAMLTRLRELEDRIRGLQDRVSSVRDTFAAAMAHADTQNMSRRASEATPAAR